MRVPVQPFAAEKYVLSSCTLRLPEDRDARLIARVLVSMEPWLSLAYTEEGLFRYLRRYDPALSRYVVLVSEEVAGLVCVRFPWLRGPCLELLALFAGFQGRGIGQEIIQWMERESCTLSGNIWVLTSSFNQAARRFYKKAGFCEVAMLPDLVTKGFDEILLRKKINPS